MNIYKNYSKKRPIKKILIFTIIPFVIILLIFSILSVTPKKVNTNLQTSTTSSNFTVCIDAGHGDNDNGTQSSDSIFEQNIALITSLKIGEILKKNGVNVIYTRTSSKTTLPYNTKENLKERVKISNEAKTDVFVSIHCNGHKNSTYKGIETWCRFPNTEGEKLAKKIQNELVNLNYSTDRGVKYETQRSLAVLKFNNSVSALVELGFLSNSSDAKFISSESGQAKCAEAIAKAILDYKSSYKKISK